MVHPLHGATHAYDTGEIERLKKLGWDVEVPKVEAPKIIQEERKKPGPKPKAK
jgi:hypothetical protein